MVANSPCVQCNLAHSVAWRYQIWVHVSHTASQLRDFGQVAQPFRAVIFSTIK